LVALSKRKRPGFCRASIFYILVFFYSDCYKWSPGCGLPIKTEEVKIAAVKTAGDHRVVIIGAKSTDDPEQSKRIPREIW